MSMKGEKIGEDKHTEHWSLDGHSYIEVPKWVVEQVRGDERERCIKAVDDYGKSMSKLRIKMIGKSHEDSKTMLAYDMHSRLIAVEEHIKNALTPPITNNKN